MLSIDKFSRIPIYEQIIAQVEMHILFGDFAPGDTLPSVRALSLSLNVNPNTLQKAYTELERRGLCQSVPGSGRFISENAKALLTQRSKDRLGELRALALELMNAGVTSQEILQCIQAAIDEAEQKEVHHD